VKASWSISALLLAGCLFTLNVFAQGAADAPKPCNPSAPEPSPAYPLPALASHDIASMFVPPRTMAQLLSNLHIVLDRQLLAQPAFFDDEVLRVLFNTTDVEWVKPGTPDVASERSVRPTRIARVRFRDSDSFVGMKADIGVNHKCLDRRPHPIRADVSIPAHTYDSGYIYIRADGPALIRIGEVRTAFGWAQSKLDRECHSPLSLYYPGPEGPSREAFALNEATFRPSHVGYAELCQAAPPRGLPDEHPISDVWIRLLEEDYTRPGAVTP